MKIKEGFVLRTIAGSNIVVPVGAASIDFNGMITLNDSGAFLWKELEQGGDADSLTVAGTAAFANGDGLRCGLYREAERGRLH